MNLVLAARIVQSRVCSCSPLPSPNQERQGRGRKLKTEMIYFDLQVHTQLYPLLTCYIMGLESTCDMS